MSPADNAGSLRSWSREGHNWRQCIFDLNAEMRDGVRKPPRRIAEMDGRVSRLCVGMHLWSQVCLMHERALSCLWDTAVFLSEVFGRTRLGEKNIGQHKQVIIKTLHQL